MARLMRQRFLPLLVMVALQLALVLSLSALLWFTRVKDRFVAYGTWQGRQVVMEVAEREASKVVVGSRVELYTEEPARPLLGRVTEIAAGEPTLVTVEVEGQPVLSGAKVKFTIETRTRRMLTLLFRK